MVTRERLAALLDELIGAKHAAMREEALGGLGSAGRYKELDAEATRLKAAILDEVFGVEPATVRT